MFQTGNTQSPLPEDADQSEFLKVAFSCDELKLDHLDGANTLIQILERYHVRFTITALVCAIAIVDLGIRPIAHIHYILI